MSKRKAQKPVPEILNKPIELHKDEFMSLALGDFERQPLLWRQLFERFRAVAEFYDIDPEHFRGRSADAETDAFEFFHELSSRISFDLPEWVSPRSVFDHLGEAAHTWRGQMLLAYSLCLQRFPDGFRFIAEGERASPQGRRREWTVRQRLALVATINEAKARGSKEQDALRRYKHINNQYFEDKIYCHESSLRSRYYEFKRWWNHKDFTLSEILELAQIYLEETSVTGSTEKDD